MACHAEGRMEMKKIEMKGNEEKKRNNIIIEEMKKRKEITK
jgi:hypothetical protein